MLFALLLITAKLPFTYPFAGSIRSKLALVGIILRFPTH